MSELWYSQEHDGRCEMKCLNCGKVGHSCRSRECPSWIQEKAICTLKVEHEISYAEARKQYEKNNKQPPTLQPYAEVVQTQSMPKQDENELREKVTRLEKKIDDMTDVLAQMTKLLKGRELPKPTQTSDATEAEKETEGVDAEMEEGGNQTVTGSSDDDIDETEPSIGGKTTKQKNEWEKAKGRNRGRGRESKTQEKVSDETNDELSQSQPVIRQITRSSERAKGKTGTETRKSWKNAD